MSIAELGYKIDSSGAVVAEANLDAMTSAAIRAESQEKKLANATVQSTAKAKKFGGQMQTSTAQTANLGAQLNDIGVMLAAGQSPLQLAVQQGTQINQVFAQMGGGQKALRGLAAGFMTMVNPMSLATIGIIAGGAALVQWATSSDEASDAIKDFSDAIDTVSEKIEEYISLSAEAKPFNAEGFDVARDRVTMLSAAYQDLITIAKIEALNSISLATNELADSVLRYSTFLGEIGDTGDLLGIETQLRGNLTVWKDNRDTAREFGDALKSLKNAGTLEAQYQSALKLRDMFRQSVDISGDMTDRQLEFWKQLNQSVYQMELLGAATVDAENHTYAAVDATDSWAASMGGVLSYLNAVSAVIASLGGNLIGSAAKQVQIDALRAGKSIADAKIASEDFKASYSAESKRTAAGSNVFKRIAAEAEIAADAVNLNRTRILNDEMAIAAEREALAAKAGGGGGGKKGKKGGSAKRDTYARDLEALIASLQTERETVDAWYAESQALLDEQRSLELLGVEGHNDAKLRLEAEYQERLADIRGGYNGAALDQFGTFMGDMANALSGGNDKMQAVAQSFASIEALINAYRAYNQVIADPSLPWFAKIPAAAGVLAAGMKTVQSIKSLSGSGGGGSASASVPSAGSASSGSSQSAIIQVTGGRSRYTIDEINDIIAGIQSQSDDGVIIEGFTT